MLARSSTILGLVVPLLLLQTDRVASACSASVCADTFIQPSADVSVPRNLPGFLVQENSLADAGMPVLRSKSGATEIPLDQRKDASGFAGQVLLTPTRVPEEGDYTLTLPASTCPGQDKTLTFKLGAELPLPTSLGTLTLSAATRGPLRVHAGAACNEEIDAVSREIVIAGPPETIAFAPVTTYTVTIDGEPWSGNRYIRTQPFDGKFVSSGPLFVYAACGEIPKQAAPGLKPGAHVAVVKAEVLGASSSPLSATVDFTLDCAAPPGPGAGGAGGGGGGTGTPSSTAADGGPSAASDAGGGCACDHTNTKTSAITSLVPILLAMLVIARRGGNR